MSLPPSECARAIALQKIAHTVSILALLVVMLILESLVTLLVEQATLDLDAVGSIGVAIKVECVCVDAAALPWLVFGRVGDPDTHRTVARRSCMVLGVHNVQLFAHHGRVKRALDLAQLAITRYSVSNADVLDALWDVLVGRVLRDAAHLFASLGLGALLSLHIHGVVLLRSFGVGDAQSGLVCETWRPSQPY